MANPNPKPGPGRPKGSRNKQPFNITKSIYEAATEEENVKLLREGYLNMLRMGSGKMEDVPHPAQIRAFEVAFKTVGITPKEFLEFLSESNDVDGKEQMLELMSQIIGIGTDEVEQELN